MPNDKKIAQEKAKLAVKHAILKATPQKPILDENGKPMAGIRGSIARKLSMIKDQNSPAYKSLSTRLDSMKKRDENKMATRASLQSKKESHNSERVEKTQEQKDTQAKFLAARIQKLQDKADALKAK